jgi:hypothetical protein
VFAGGAGGPADPTDDTPPPLDPAYRGASPEVRAYLEERRQRMDILATTTTWRGSVYDWIDVRPQV